MGQINENIANNIIKLRKLNKLTQQDLAIKINYSDKAISKWERGDSVPDIEMLCKLSEIFNVDVNYLTKEHSDSEIHNLDNNSNFFVRNLLILIMLCVSMFLLSTIVFTIATLKSTENAKIYWISFIFSVPVCSLFAHIYAKKNNYWLMKLIAVSTLLWSIITSLYCLAIVLGYPSFWMLYIVGAPIQVAIGLFYFWKKTF